MTLFKTNYMKFLFSKLTLVLILCQAGLLLNAQTVKLLNSTSKASLRGLCVVDDNTVWVSGSGGTVGRSVDGGNNWTWMTVKGFEKADFRDIEAFDAKTAVIMGIASPAYILKTTDGGTTWNEVFKDTAKEMFFWMRWISGIKIIYSVQGAPSFEDALENAVALETTSFSQGMSETVSSRARLMKTNVRMMTNLQMRDEGWNLFFVGRRCLKLSAVAYK